MSDWISFWDTNHSVYVSARHLDAHYRRIADDLGIDPARLLFLSDIEDELAAARAAGWQAVGVVRAGEEQATAQEPSIASFGAVRHFKQLILTRERELILGARALGWSWELIAGSLGVTPQAAHQRWNRLVDKEQVL